MEKLNRTLSYLFNAVFFLFACSGLCYGASGCNCDVTIEENILYVDGNALKITPGSTVCIKSSVKKYLGFANINGTAENPVIIINCGGKVTVKNNDWYYGIRINNCSHFRLTGTGEPKLTYGFAVMQTGDQIPGVSIGMMSSDMEIDHIEIANTGFAGILAKTDPDCSGIPNRGNFVQKNTFIHDNYIHNTKGEGVYLGFPHYRGVFKDCNGISIRVLPHDLVGVRVYNNLLENIGREGLQVGCATSDVKIYSNKIENYGRNNDKYQSAGVHLSTGTTGELYNNMIADGSGPGLWLNGAGANFVYNNVFTGIAKNGDMAILLEDSMVAPGKGYHIINNTILSEASSGVVLNNNFNSSGNEFINNILVTARGDNFFSVANPDSWREVANISAEHTEGLYLDGFMLSDKSPMIDNGIEVPGLPVPDDYVGNKRPRGNGIDIGAIESPYVKEFDDFLVYPSPFAGEAKIVFFLKEDTEVSLGLYDARGVLVKEIIPAKKMYSMSYNYSLSDTDLSSGVYFCRLQRGKKFKAKKVVVQK